MKRAVWILLVILFSAVGIAVVGEGASAGIEDIRIEWPSVDARDLQSVIDTAPNGATIEIKQGVYQLSEPLYVRGKRLTFVGAGSGLMAGRRAITHLVGPSPNPVVDERGNLVLFADAVKGLWNLIGADVEIRDMQLTGFDAGIVVRAAEGDTPGPTVVTNVLIMDTGRGILSMSSSDLTVQHSTIINTLWHGISVGPPQPNIVLGNFLFDAFQIINPGKAGIYVLWGNVTIQNGFVYGAQAGGIVAFQMHALHVLSCNLLGNKEAGILMQGVNPGLGQLDIVIQDNIIQNTQQLDSKFGDGIVAMLFPGQQSLVASLFDNTITSSQRVGVSSFGADLILKGNTILCSPFDLDGEVFQPPLSGIPYTFQDLGGNNCGCPGIPPGGSTCIPSSSTLSSPPMVGGLQ